MSYGFSAINTSGQVIISDEMENLHFLGKATLNSNDGGGHNNYGSDGRIIFTYTITTSATPLVFIKPTDYARWHAVLTQSVSGSTWTFDVIVSGTSSSNPPELFCFVNANSTSGTTSTHGLVVWKSDGTTRTFDSRYNPLVVTGGGTIAPDSCPSNDGCPTTTSGHPWNYNTLDHDFGSENQYNSSAISGTYTDLMFSAPSLVQGVYKRQAEGYKCSPIPWYEGGGCQPHWSTAMWWFMYRGGFRIRSGYFDAGWIGYSSGYSFSSTFESGGWFGGGGGGFSTGSMPYTAKTINYTSNAYMIADSTRYG